MEQGFDTPPPHPEILMNNMRSHFKYLCSSLFSFSFLGSDRLYSNNEFPLPRFKNPFNLVSFVKFEKLHNGICEGLLNVKSFN